MIINLSRLVSAIDSSKFDSDDRSDLLTRATNVLLHALSVKQRFDGKPTLHIFLRQVVLPALLAPLVIAYAIAEGLCGGCGVPYSSDSEVSSSLSAAPEYDGDPDAVDDDGRFENAEEARGARTAGCVGGCCSFTAGFAEDKFVERMKKKQKPNNGAGYGIIRIPDQLSRNLRLFATQQAPIAVLVSLY
jgi:hypothetical protein